MATPNYGLIEIVPGQANKELDLNRSLRLIDALLSGVISRSLAAPPATPIEGDFYIVAAAGASGAWALKENYLAVYVNAAWAFIAPNTRIAPVWVSSEQVTVKWTGTAWAIIAGTGDMSASVYVDTGGTGIVLKAKEVQNSVLGFNIPVPEVGIIDLISFPIAKSVNSLINLRTTAGTATLTLRVLSTAITGLSGLSANSGYANYPATANNTMAALTSVLRLDITSVSSAANLSGTIVFN